MRGNAHITASLVAVALAAALVATACSGGQVQRRESTGGETRYVEGAGVVTTVPVDDRDPAPEFSGPLLEGGSTYDLADQRGDVVVLNVWGSWCPPCRKEAPALQATYESTRDLGVQFVGVNTRDTETGARAYVEEFGITYPSVVDTTGARLLAFRDTLPPAAIPSTLVVDREGRLAARVLGEISETSLQALVTDIAAEETAEAARPAEAPSTPPAAAAERDPARDPAHDPRP